MIQLNDWLSIDKTSGEGDATITLTASSSIALQDRIQKLTIKGVTKNNYVTVQQKRFIAEFYLANDNIVSQKEGGVFTNTVTSNLPWVAEVSGSWINMSVLSGDVGTTDFSVTINSAFIERDGNVIFKTLNGDILGVMSVTQLGDLITDKFWIEFEEPNGEVKVERHFDSLDYVSDIEYSFDGVEWTNSYTISMGDNLLVFIRNKNDDIHSSTYSPQGERIYFSKRARIGGDITELVKRMGDYCCGELFTYSAVTDASKLILPWSKLSYRCFNGMFSFCESLITPPQLPATELAESCYSTMFNACHSLKNAPQLPATKLTKGCYFGMFNTCYSLTTPPQLPATELAESCYESMFEYCELLKTAPELPATILEVNCYKGMFRGCISLVTAPQIYAEVLKENCCQEMFALCTSLVTAPVLSATELADYCYYYMFAGCSSLFNPPQLPATTLKENCYAYMFNNCSSLTTAPVLSAPKLLKKSYYRMFRNCSNLQYIKMLATEMYDDNYGNGSLWSWVDGVSPNGTFVKHPNANIPSGISGIPEGWTVETATE